MVEALEPGDKAPPFSLATDDGARISHKDFLGHPIVLYFYPKDDTPGCTKQAIAFTDIQSKFKRLKTPIIGVSKDSITAHQKFRLKHKLGIILASDPDGKTIESYGSWVEKSLYGRKYMGIDRSTFLIDAKGRVTRIWRKVKVQGHAEEVLAELRSQ